MYRKLVERLTGWLIGLIVKRSRRKSQSVDIEEEDAWRMNIN